MSVNLIGSYLVNGTVGNVGMPGAPIMHFSLVVVPSLNSVSGSVEITQALAPPNGLTTIKQVTGVIRATGYGKVTHIVSLQGTYNVDFPPPAIGFTSEKFTAHMAIDNEWNGTGGFTYGRTDIENVPVKRA
ncbi:DUF1842 domain-containing protein [Glaciimonas immobilis]|uniref:DUF1842 domain-containing protein n=1 Tax=Glaciimonas immobilis TaxID=728004 RepID=A0A840RYS1_9BURK|nr:DUF1842 domain-containing protein [Glaciimonas immobilis]KAF3995909.1 DUF1842 domain-containing protein [Glaciimonas immobilis]MBB5202693.1 hypothetical protein [Glaciimonas immobilis]